MGRKVFDLLAIALRLRPGRRGCGDDREGWNEVGRARPGNALGPWLHMNVADSYALVAAERKPMCSLGVFRVP